MVTQALQALEVPHQFLADLRASHSPRTYHVYTYWLRRWFASTDQPLSVEAAQRFLSSLGVAPASTHVAAAALRAWFRANGIQPSFELPKVPWPSPKYLEQGEVEQLIKSCKTPLEEALVVLLFDTAVRISELLNLRVSDVFQSLELIRVIRKGGRAADVNVSSRGMATLLDWLHTRKTRSDRVFGSLSYVQAWRILRRVGNRAGVSFHPHQLRHSRAFQMLSAGAALDVVREHLGHKSITTTSDIYGRLAPIRLKEKIPEW